MNKVMIGLVLAVLILGMALAMLNERLGRKTESRPSALTMQANDAGLENEARKPVQELERQIIPDAAATKPIETPAMPEAALPAPQAETTRKAESLPDGLQPKPNASRSDLRPNQPPDKELAPPEPESRPAVKAPVPDVGKATPKANARTESQPRQKVAQTSHNAPAKAENPRAQAGREISKFVVLVRDNGATLRLNANAPMQYKSMNLEDPPRLVLDLDGQWQVKTPAIPKNSLVSRVRIGQSGDKTRVVIDLKEKLRSTRLVPGHGGESLDLRLDK